MAPRSQGLRQGEGDESLVQALGQCHDISAVKHY